MKAIIAWGFEPTAAHKAQFKVPVLSWDEFVARGKEVEEQLLDDRISDQKPGECCALIYTSGTTGTPKAVMISHDNIIFEACCAMNDIPIGKKYEEERVISYLPLSHVAGMLVDIISPLYVTARDKGWVTVHYARPYDLSKGTVGNRLRAVKPTLFLGVPRVWEKIALKIKKIGAQTKGIKKKNRLILQRKRYRACPELSNRWQWGLSHMVQVGQQVSSKQDQGHTWTRTLQVRLHWCCSHRKRDPLLLRCPRHPNQ